MTPATRLATPAWGWRWSATLAAGLSAAARRAAPREACGVLLGRRRHAASNDGGELLLAPALRNLSPESDRFALDPIEVLGFAERARQRGLALLGFWHSHVDTDPSPSPHDLHDAWPGFLMLIVGHAGRAPTLRLWRVAPTSATISSAQRLNTL